MKIGKKYFYYKYDVVQKMLQCTHISSGMSVDLTVSKVRREESPFRVRSLLLFQTRKNTVRFVILERGCGDWILLRTFKIIIPRLKRKFTVKPVGVQHLPEAC